MSYASSDELKIFPNETFPEPPEKPSFYEPFKCHTRAWGFHREGNYIMAYTPEAKQDNSSSKNLKIVIYLHGFAFGNPFFYDAHLQHLAKQGYYVFFPDYQKDKYRDSQKPEPSEQIHSINDLIDAVVESLDSTPKEMIEKLIESTKCALKELGLSPQEVDIYLFGHSVGGLFALSLPYYKDALIIPRIKGIIAASPVRSTLELPEWMLHIIHKIKPNAKFLNNPIDIRETGEALKHTPVAILLGNEDSFASLNNWQTVWDAITASQKRLYISQSDYYNPRPEKALIAYHNQAVTNIIIPNIPEALQILTIGSPGKEDNMRWRYIWYALDQVLEGRDVENLCFKDMGQWNWIVPKKVKGVDSWP